MQLKNTVKTKWQSLRKKWLDIMPNNDVTLRRLAIVCTVQFSLFLVWALWLKFNDMYSITQNYSWLSKMNIAERFRYDLIPFIIRYDHFRQILQLFCNGLVFTPFGILLNLIFKKENIWRDLLICFTASLTIELVQLFTVIGAFATADLIMNTLGYLIGYAIYKLVFLKLEIKRRVISFEIACSLFS